MFRILIVEDDHANYILLKKVINSRFSVEISRAENGLEALKFLEKNEVDGMILDVSMPVMNGLEVLETIRRNNELADLPVIMLSAINSREEVETAMKFGVFDYLLKPFYAEQTIHRLEKYFDFLMSRNERKDLEVISENKNHLLIISPDVKKWDDVKEKIDAKYDCRIFRSTTSGLEYFLKEFPDVIVLDKDLPAISECIIAKKIKRTLSEKNNMNIDLHCSIIGCDNYDSPDFDHTITDIAQLEDLLMNNGG